MQDLLDNPAFQAGIAPLIVALIVALLLARTPAAWLAIFGQDLKAALLAELDTRLQPAEGLLDALRNETSPA